MESLIAFIRAHTSIVRVNGGEIKKMMNGRTSMGWIGASLAIAGGLLGLYGWAIMDFTSVRILNWYGLDFTLLRIGIAAAVAGIATVLVANFEMTEKVSPIAKLPVAQEQTPRQRKEIEIPA